MIILPDLRAKKQYDRARRKTITKMICVGFNVLLTKFQCDSTKTAQSLYFDTGTAHAHSVVAVMWLVVVSGFVKESSSESDLFIVSVEPVHTIHELWISLWRFEALRKKRKKKKYYVHDHTSKGIRNKCAYNTKSRGWFKILLMNS